MAKYAVGIDLGTTNSALAYATIGRSKSAPAVKMLAATQHFELAELAHHELFPSFIYLAADHEQPLVQPLPWQSAAPTLILGEGGRRLGSRSPGRLIDSAKSWLCHPGVDRQAEILPWQGDESLPRLSPVQASALYLEHLRRAWDATIAKGDPELELSRQQLVLTAPASFDAVARELTVAAARHAGLENFTLLEEPIAAFTHYLASHPDPEDLPAVGSVCLVVDVGGGTTDLSLIKVAQRDGAPVFERLAVGEHLLLGGDNMDLALARRLEPTLSPARRLDVSQWRQLVTACRRVKETMLGDNPPAAASVAITGKGRQVIGGSLSCDVDRALVIETLLDGFFPLVDFDEPVQRESAAGLREFGLPYVADPAITRHLSDFLRQHADAIGVTKKSPRPLPTAVLFNGGVFNAPACRQRVVEVMHRWSGSKKPPTVLTTDSFDLAVAKGAAIHAWSLAKGQRLVHGGAPRAFYLAVLDAQQTDPNKVTVVCVAPQGMNDGDAHQIEHLPLALQLGQPVAFELFASMARTKDQPGDIKVIERDRLHLLPPLTTVLRGGKRTKAKEVDVRLEVVLTAIGVLELYCVTVDGQHRWRLQFETRAQPATPLDRRPAEAVTETWDADDLTEAKGIIADVYATNQGRKDPQSAIDLPRRLEAALKLSRSDWPTGVLRSLWEELAEHESGRSASLEHECRWLNLAGFCLRPGFGDVVDPHRVEQCWKIVDRGVENASQVRAWTELWILQRRMAGGLDPARQKELFKRLSLYVMPGSKKLPRKPGPQEWNEMVRTIASLELLATPTKTQLGQTLLALRTHQPIPQPLFWALTRIGSRQLAYGPANLVIKPSTAEEWILQLLELDPGEDQRRSEWLFALSQLARCTGDRARDIDPALRSAVSHRLRSEGAKESWIRMVEEPSGWDQTDLRQMLGDAPPPGLRLRS